MSVVTFGGRETLLEIKIIKLFIKYYFHKETKLFVNFGKLNLDGD